MKVIIIGAGAAGLMAAGTVLADEIVVLEKNEKSGKKLYITGKGRCNVTNDCESKDFLLNVVSNPKFLLGCINSFAPQNTMQLLENNGVTLKTERGGRVFPLSDKASDITGALVAYAQKNGARFVFNCTVKAIVKVDDGFIIKTDGADYSCDKVVVAMGGKSYCATGSTGDGYRLAKMLGHSIIEPVPALVPIDLAENVSDLMGLSLKNVTAAIKNNEKQVASKFGEMLFTNKGVSGPIILSLSSLINRTDCSKLKLSIDLKPALSTEVLDKRILGDFSKNTNKALKNSLNELMPKSLVPVVITKSGINGDTAVNSITKVQRTALVNTIKGLSFNIDKLCGIDAAIVTAGGVATSEVSPKTMESKLVKGLFFAGEMLDVDAFTGGYNIQIALSTAYAAGIGASK